MEKPKVRKQCEAMEKEQEAQYKMLKQIQHCALFNHSIDQLNEINTKEEKQLAPQTTVDQKQMATEEDSELDIEEDKAGLARFNEEFLSLLRRINWWIVWLFVCALDAFIIE
eukprot:960925_1